MTLTPGSSTALLRSSRCSSACGIAAESKYLASGHTCTRVPFFFSPRSNLREASGTVTSPPENVSVEHMPSRQTVTSSCVDSALVTDTPTPCRPPEKA
ncbi:hypothetical protein D9M68_823820 [compost metagenome]